MMENRSYDHLLGFSGITGTDTQTGQQTSAEGLTGGEYNLYKVPTGTIVAPHPPKKVNAADLAEWEPPEQPQPYTTCKFVVSPTAGDITDWQGNPPSGLDPSHQFPDVLMQLCGQQQTNANLNGSSYPKVLTNMGFAENYATTDKGKGNPGEVMLCFSKEHLPVLNALAHEFVICDHWFSAMAGPTEPNRMFAHAATSDVWDDSPQSSDYARIFGEKTVVSGTENDTDFVINVVSLGQAHVEVGSGGRSYGISFDHGTIFDRLRQANIPFRIYAGDAFPQVGLLKGISLTNDCDDFGDFAADVNDPNYDAAYTFIEPRYDTISQHLYQPFVNNSQHSSSSVALGEDLIKTVYEAVRNSPHWDESMLIIVWDEHGGFYDHVPPPRAVPTGSKGQSFGFMFDQYGPRVPAIVISPWCPRNMVEHRQLEHSVIPATVEQVFGVPPLTVRDTGITGLQTLATLNTPRAVQELTLTPVPAPNPTAPAPWTVLEPQTTETSQGGTQNVQPGHEGILTANLFAASASGTPVPLTPAASAPSSPVNLPAGAVALTATHFTVSAAGASVPLTPVASASSSPVNLPAGAVAAGMTVAATALAPKGDLSLPLSSISDPWLAAALAASTKAHMEAAPADAPNIQARVSGLKTLGDLGQYYDEMSPIVNNARVLARQQRVLARQQRVAAYKSGAEQN
jgi:phospholipase C